MGIYTISSSVVIRKESDDWGILFEPDTGKAFALNLVAMHVCALLSNGPRSRDSIMTSIVEYFDDIPETLIQDISTFLDQLIEQGLAHENTEIN